MDLQAEDIIRGYMVIIPDPSKPDLEGRIYVQDLINDCLESITSCDEPLRMEFQKNLTTFLNWTEKRRKPDVLLDMRRTLRANFIECLGNDRAKYDTRLMKQLDLIIQLAEGVGFKARTDLREEFKQREKQDEEED